MLAEFSGMVHQFLDFCQHALILALGRQQHSLLADPLHSSWATIAPGESGFLIGPCLLGRIELLRITHEQLMQMLWIALAQFIEQKGSDRPARSSLCSGYGAVADWHTIYSPGTLLNVNSLEHSTTSTYPVVVSGRHHSILRHQLTSAAAECACTRVHQGLRV